MSGEWVMSEWSLLMAGLAAKDDGSRPGGGTISFWYDLTLTVLTNARPSERLHTFPSAFASASGPCHVYDSPRVWLGSGYSQAYSARARARGGAIG